MPRFDPCRTVLPPFFFCLPALTVELSLEFGESSTPVYFHCSDREGTQWFPPKRESENSPLMLDSWTQKAPGSAELPGVNEVIRLVGSAS
jgi:hypothetical protein